MDYKIRVIRRVGSDKIGHWEIIDKTEKVTEQAHESNQAEQESNQVRLTAKQRKVLEFCDEMPRTAQEILDMVGVKYHTKTLD